MGHLFSSPINSMIVDYLKSLQEEGNDLYTVEEYQTEFDLNKCLGSDHAPKCHMFVKNSSIQCQDMTFDSQPLSMKSSKITIQIGEAVVRCDDLGYILRVTGKISIYDVHITASFTPTFANGIRVTDIGSETTVNKIKSEIELYVNGTCHSRLVNVLLSIDNPHVAGNLIEKTFKYFFARFSSVLDNYIKKNAMFMLQKENLKDILNENIRDIASQYGL